MHKLWQALEGARSLRWVELSHQLDNSSPYWSGIPDGSVDLGNVVFDWGNPMLECQIQTFKFPGQFGTHIDFPAHFIKDAATSESFGVKDAVFPLCVIDISEKVKAEPTYCVTVDDIKAWEAVNGAIPEGAFVALRTDWAASRWPDMNAMSGIAADGSENFPAWSLEAIQYIYEVRHAAANGHETFDTDGSAECIRQGDLACERYVLAHGKVQIELLCNLDKLPATGAVLIAAWPNFKGANGLPCRVYAITE